jgi:hypothetical protein
MTAAVPMRAVEAMVRPARNDVNGASTPQRQPSHPCVTIDRVTDNPSPVDLEQLARSVAMSGVLGDRDRLEVVKALRRLAAIDRAKRRHPSNGRGGHTLVTQL